MTPSFTGEDVDIIEKQTAFRGYFRIDHYRLKHRLFEGGWSQEMSREIFERGHSVTALLLDPDLDRLVFIEQFRVGAFCALSSPWFEDGFSPWLVEFIAGIIKEGETPEQVARREAVEEANCEITDMVPVCHYLVSPGGTTESVFVFCGRVDSSAANGIQGISEEHENIRVFSVPVDEALDWLDKGSIANAITLIAMQWFKLNHEGLRARWLGPEQAEPGP